MMTFSFGSLVAGLAILVLAASAASAGEAREGESPSIRKLTERLEAAKPVEVDAIVSSFIQENQDDLPLIEDSLVTFVYYGTVALRATVPSDINRWDTSVHQMHRLGETDLYYLTLVMPADARIDYKFYVDGLWMLDPLNDQTVRGGFGDNSAFAMPLYEPPAEIEFLDSIPHGALEEHMFNSKIIVGARKVEVYLPDGYDDDKDYPMVLVQDGGEYVTLASMVNVMDNIIHEKRIPPVVAVFVPPVDRNYEYYLNADYERVLLEEILPFIEETYSISGDPRKRAIMGASLGGAISMMISMNHPEVFGKCGSQSGAFGVNEMALIQRVLNEPGKDISIYLDCGTFGDITDENRAMADALKKRKYDFVYAEFNEGHSWGNWRAHIDDMLVFFWGK
jgi:enterochelin esterase family protein